MSLPSLSVKECELNILNYCTINDSRVSFTRAQASQFAKLIAGDFNPIHDVDARRFCVPGDLLFMLMLMRYGVADSTLVEFKGMVGDGTELALPESIVDNFTLADSKNREYLKISYSHQPQFNSEFAGALATAYVQFSGQTFPDILVDLMRTENVMINPNRPLVIYKQMSVELTAFKSENLALKFDGASMNTDGKKGQAQLNFILKAGEEVIGRGQKIMLLGGLRPYDQNAIDGIVETYNAAKAAFQMSTAV